MVNKRNIDAEMVVALAGELVMGQAPTTIMGSMVWANRETGGVAVSLNFRSDHPLLGDATITVGGNSPINGQAETDPPVDPEESFGVNTPTYQLTGGGVRVINRKGKPKDHFTLECPFEDVVSVRIQLTEGPKG